MRQLLPILAFLFCLASPLNASAMEEFKPLCSNSIPGLVNSGELGNFAFTCPVNATSNEYCNFQLRSDCILAFDSSDKLRIVDEANLPGITEELRNQIAAYLSLWNIEAIELMETVEDKSAITNSLSLISPVWRWNEKVKGLRIPAYPAELGSHATYRRATMEVTRNLPAVLGAIHDLTTLAQERGRSYTFEIHASFEDLRTNKIAAIVAMLQEEKEIFWQRLADWKISQIEIDSSARPSRRSILVLNMNSPAIMREMLVGGQFPPFEYKYEINRVVSTKTMDDIAVKTFSGSEQSSLELWCDDTGTFVNTNRTLHFTLKASTGTYENEFTFNEEAACQAFVAEFVKQVEERDPAGDLPLAVVRQFELYLPLLEAQTGE